MADLKQQLDELGITMPGEEPALKPVPDNKITAAEVIALLDPPITAPVIEQGGVIPQLMAHTANLSLVEQAYIVSEMQRIGPRVATYAELVSALRQLAVMLTGEHQDVADRVIDLLTRAIGGVDAFETRH